jgi:hypothetical protein
MRIKIAAAVIALAGLGGGLALTAPAASAGGGAKWDYEDTGSYPNAWGGGPAVDVYNGTAGNDDFALVGCGGTCVHLEFGNGGAYQGYCISDYANESGSPRAWLNYCGGSAPWGSNLSESYCSVNGKTGLQFYDAHWQKFLAPGGGNNGQAYYLNQAAACFVIEGPS